MSWDSSWLGHPSARAGVTVTMTAAAAALLDGVPRAEERIGMAAAEILAGETAQAPA